MLSDFPQATNMEFLSGVYEKCQHLFPVGIFFIDSHVCVSKTSSAESLLSATNNFSPSSLNAKLAY